MVDKDTTKVISYEITNSQAEPERVPRNVIKVGAESKWKQGYTGKGVVVAVLDTGCDIMHPDLQDNILGGYNFSDDHKGDIAIYQDLNGHGTHVAGVIAAKKNKSGIIGVAPDVKLLIVKVLNKDSNGTVTGLIDGIHYALDWTGPEGEKVDIVSLSLSTPSHSDDLEAAIKRAVNLNIPVVVASGNYGDGNIDTHEYAYPAAYHDVIAVGALDQDNVLAYFSNTNEEVDLYAPGKDILSTHLNESYVELSGTSMAAPHVTGALALLIQELEAKLGRRDLTEALIFKALMELTIQSKRERINILDLTRGANAEQSKNQIRRETLMKCFCETRKTQAFYTKCIDETSSQQEKDFLIELVQESAKASSKIQNFCNQMD